MKKKVGLLFGAFFVSAQVSAQPIDATKLNPEIVAASSCAGMLSGVALDNYDSEVLNKERTKNILYATSLYFLAVAFKEASPEHLQEYGAQYDTITSNARNNVISMISAGDYGWDTQSEVDVCDARMVSTLTMPLPERLESDEVKADLRKLSDDNFEAMLRINEAMK